MMRTSLRDGFARVDLVVCLFLVAVAAAVALPSIRAMRSTTTCGPSYSGICRSNQRQIAAAMLVYASDNHGEWPVFVVDIHGMQVSHDDPSFDPITTAIASCEFLASTMDGDLTDKTFTCLRNPSAKPTAKTGDMSPTGPHYSQWGALGPSRFGYAYDWSVPRIAANQRVITADRNSTVHGTRVLAAFADGRAEFIAGTGGTFINRDVAEDDDIYTAIGDGPMGVPGSGSATRAFVR